MASPNTPDYTPENLSAAPKRVASTEPNFTGPPKPIEELAGRPDFPKCAHGEFVDIRGYAGVVVEIVNQSIKVRSPEGITQSFNFNRLRILYGSAPQPEAVDRSRTVERPEPIEESTNTPSQAPRREVIAEADFDRDVKAISVFAVRPDFPQCAFGEYVDIRGYAGVVVEIVNQSLKVRSPEGITRSYNADILRKLHGTP